MDVAALRAQIPATSRVTYLNTGYSGPPPRPVVDAMTKMLELQASEGPTSPYAFNVSRVTKTEARTAFARLLKADPEEIVLTENTTRGVNIIVSGLPWRSGDEIVTSTTEHFGVLIPLYELRRRAGVAIRFVELDPQADEASLMQALETAITAKTRLLVLSHIMFTNGLRLPVAAIQQLARRKGAQVLFDAAQCSGQLDLDVHGWGCDYYAVPGHKWLLGPAGTGALFIRQDLVSGVAPTQVSQMAAASFDYCGSYEPAPARQEKFEVSTVSPALHAGVAAAVDFLSAIGMDQIEDRWTQLTDRLRAGLRNVPGVTLVSPPGGATASGLVTFTVAGWEPLAVVDEFWKQERAVIRAVVQPPAVRVSVDFFNTEDEIDRVIDLVQALARQGHPE